MGGSTILKGSVNLPTIAVSWQIAGAGDFNDDGYADLVWQNSNTGDRAIWLLRNGGYKRSVNLPTVERSWQIANH